MSYLLLTTTGAKSGEPRVSPLVVFRIDGKLLIVAGYGGADVNPAWVVISKINVTTPVFAYGQKPRASSRYSSLRGTSHDWCHRLHDLVSMDGDDV
jgi:hypothetical protein